MAQAIPFTSRKSAYRATVTRQLRWNAMMIAPMGRMSGYRSIPTGSRWTFFMPLRRRWEASRPSRVTGLAIGDGSMMNSEAGNQESSAVPGKIELMMGPMRSNKTAELLRRAEMRRQYAKQYVLVLKPSDDTKGGPGLVESRTPNGHARMQAIEFNSSDPWPILDKIAEVEQQIGKRVEFIAIDEG